MVGQYTDTAANYRSVPSFRYSLLPVSHQGLGSDQGESLQFINRI